MEVPPQILHRIGKSIGIMVMMIVLVAISRLLLILCSRKQMLCHLRLVIHEHTALKNRFKDRPTHGLWKRTTDDELHSLLLTWAYCTLSWVSWIIGTDKLHPPPRFFLLSVPKNSDLAAWTCNSMDGKRIFFIQEGANMVVIRSR